MMTALKTWLTAILTTTVLLTVAEKLVPEGPLRKIASMTGGLILLIVLVRPLAKLQTDALQIDYDSYAAAIGERQAELQAENDQALAACIAERTEAYISDKAASLGLSCQVKVATQTGEDGIPRPYSAVLSCGQSAELSAYIEEELGIPKERQVFHGTQ